MKCPRVPPHCDPLKARSYPVIVLLLTIFASAASAQVFKTVLSFPGGTEGAEPPSASIMVSLGNIFGATSQGGNTACSSPLGCGLIYQLTPGGSETVLYSFGGASMNDGASPNVPAINPITHQIEGTTSGGGTNTAACPNGCGTAYAIDSDGQETILHVFAGSPDANLPAGTSVFDTAGNLYGVSFYGGGLNGDTGHGTVFTIKSTGQESLLYRFKAPPDGTNPNGALVRDAAGNLYGTTTYGGSGSCNNGFLPGCGTVFKIDASGTETVLHSFTGGSDSQFPTALVQDASGNLFGAANNNGKGVIFKLDASGNFSVIYSGSLAAGINNLVLRPSGGFFVTLISGSSFCPSGCVAELQPNGSGYKPVLLKAFDGIDGNDPDSLVLTKGALYGTTYQGGNSNLGTVFEITP